MTPAKLRAVRRRLGLTQAALAEALGLTANMVAMMERGERDISPRTEKQIAGLMALAKSKTAAKAATEG